MPHLLLTGVSPKWLESASKKGYDINPEMTSSNVATQAKQLIADLDATPEITYKIFQFDPEDPADLDTFKSLLQDHKWDGISLGGGVRTIPELTDCFVSLVNTAVQNQPQAKFMFPMAVKEVMPQIRKYVLT